LLFLEIPLTYRSSYLPAGQRILNQNQFLRLDTTPLERFLYWEDHTPNATFLRQPIHDTWHVFTYRDAGREVRRLAAMLQQLLPVRSHVAILSKNCAHWLIADLAIMLSGNVSVPIYPTLSAGGIHDVLAHSEARLIILGKLDNFNLQKGGIPEDLPRISFPFYGTTEGRQWDDLPDASEFIEQPLPTPEDVATIMYSSGTTGTPKGVVITHGAFGFVGERVAKHLAITKPNRFFSYLPLSHIAERALMEMVAIHTGSTISFSESLEKFQENIQHEKPTIFGGVPRIYTKFQEGILKKLPQKKLDSLLRIPFVGSVVKKTIRKKLGFTDARIIVSGAAPSPVSQLEWFKRIGIEISEMYGMTENTAFSHSNYGITKPGTVGRAWPENEVKLSEDGEILVRSRALMKGYFKDDETTRTVFTADGFLRTGDSGEIDAEGFLTITGRVRDQFKTDKGKFIAPAPIEKIILSNTDIEQVCVVGMGLPQPVALINLSATGQNRSRIEVINSLESTLKKLNPTLEFYERIEKIVVMKETWSIENGLLTPSLKLKRAELEKRYLAEFKAWYSHPETVVWEEEVV
jgi:Long-chain acyl-CoA synthetases (AMP-forming)